MKEYKDQTWKALKISLHIKFFLGFFQVSIKIKKTTKNPQTKRKKEIMFAKIPMSINSLAGEKR